MTEGTAFLKRRQSREIKISSLLINNQLRMLAEKENSRLIM
jgi:hypothetical protein